MNEVVVSLLSSAGAADRDVRRSLALTGILLRAARRVALVVLIGAEQSSYILRADTEDGTYTFIWLQSGGALEAKRVGTSPPAAIGPALTADELKAYEGTYPLASTFSLRVFVAAGKLIVQGATWTDRSEARRDVGAVQTHLDVYGKLDVHTWAASGKGHKNR